MSQVGFQRVGSELQEHEFVDSGAETAVIPARPLPLGLTCGSLIRSSSDHLFEPGRGVIADDPQGAWGPFRENPWFGPECFFGADASDGATTIEAARRRWSAGLVYAAVQSPVGRGDLVAYHVRCFRR